MFLAHEQLELADLDQDLVNKSEIAECQACTTKHSDSTINAETCQSIMINIDQPQVEFVCECD